jgi:hypothetical protein
MTPEHATYLEAMAEVESLRAERLQSAKDWCDDDDEIRKQALRVLPGDVVNGDTYAVPRFGELAKLLADEVETLRAKLKACKALFEQVETYWYEGTEIGTLKRSDEYETAKEACK